MLAARYVGFVPAVVLHTAYEAVEGEIFPFEDRDVSMLNHVGDSVAFVAGWLVMQQGVGGRR